MAVSSPELNRWDTPALSSALGKLCDPLNKQRRGFLALPSVEPVNWAMIIHNSSFDFDVFSWDSLILIKAALTLRQKFFGFDSASDVKKPLNQHWRYKSQPYVEQDKLRGHGGLFHI
jgi:hypothetical protein